jgi:hypothetical protein
MSAGEKRRMRRGKKDKKQQQQQKTIKADVTGWMKKKRLCFSIVETMHAVIHWFAFSFPSLQKTPITFFFSAGDEETSPVSPN